MICLIAFVLCQVGSAQIPARLIATRDLWNAWFDADPSVYFVSMTNRLTAHWGANVHPMLAFFMYTPVFVLTRGLGFAKPEAARVTMSLAGAGWVGATFLLARVLGCRRIDSALVGGLAATCSGAMFVFVIPELHAFGGVTLVLCLMFTALGRRRQFSDRWHVAMSGLSASATVTNWPLGLLPPYLAGGGRRCTKIAALSAVLLMTLSVVQHLVFPTATLFLWRSEGYARTFTHVPTPIRIAEVTQAFLFHPVVMPKVGTIGSSRGRPVGSPRWPYRALSVQRAVPGSESAAGLVAVTLWTILLSAGALAWFRDHRDWLVLPCALAAQWALYVIFGDETFLYSLNWLPFLLAFAALAVATFRGVAMRLVLIALLAANGFNNVAQFQLAIDMLNHPDRHPAMTLSRDPR